MKFSIIVLVNLFKVNYKNISWYTRIYRVLLISSLFFLFLTFFSNCKLNIVILHWFNGLSYESLIETICAEKWKSKVLNATKKIENNFEVKEERRYNLEEMTIDYLKIKVA